MNKIKQYVYDIERLQGGGRDVQLRRAVNQRISHILHGGVGEERNRRQNANSLKKKSVRPNTKPNSWWKRALAGARRVFGRSVSSNSVSSNSVPSNSVPSNYREEEKEIYKLQMQFLSDIKDEDLRKIMTQKFKEEWKNNRRKWMDEWNMPH